MKIDTKKHKVFQWPEVRLLVEFIDSASIASGASEAIEAHYESLKSIDLKHKAFHKKIVIQKPNF